MKNMLIILLILVSGKLSAQINLPAFFSDNMILQRNAEVNFWGWGNRGSEITITPSWSNQPIKVKTSGHARFETKLKTPEAGGPYEITIVSGAYKKILKNILIGEVWLCSGQSNMQWNANNQLKEMLDELPEANHANIRLLNISNVASLTPQDDIFDSWVACTSETVRNFSAIGYFIAKQLQAYLKVPIGVINSSWGGTAAEFWTPANVILEDAELLQNAKKQRPAPSKPHEPGSLWTL